MSVELELAGHRRISKTITPRSGQPIAIDETMRPVEGQLVVIPTPDTATVLVDGRAKGEGKVQVNGLPLDRTIEVRVELDGYRTFKQGIELNITNPKQTLAVPLARDPRRRDRATRKVMLTTPFGTWASVYYRGKFIGSTPIEAVLPVGSIKLRIRNDEIKLNKEIRVQIPPVGPEPNQAAVVRRMSTTAARM